jgi:hypothetical protein
MVDILPIFEIPMGGFCQKGSIGQFFRGVGFLEINILFMDDASNGQGFNGLEPGAMDILKIHFGQGIDFWQQTRVTKYHIAIIGIDDVGLDIRNGMVYRKINLVHNLGMRIFYY